jgi:hypothetical protein
MEGYKKCEIGHLFKDDLTMCPYCPSAQNASSGQINKLSDKTEINLGGFSSTRKLVDSDAVDHPTEIFGSNQTSNQETKVDLSRTIIQNLEVDEAGKNVIKENTRVARKIIGWIISYSHDSMGMDFRLFEGNNTIGRDASNTITIGNDTAISGKHVTILFRLNKCYIKDEMASNGTFINGDLIGVGQPCELNDGDVIGLGSTTTFKYRTAF